MCLVALVIFHADWVFRHLHLLLFAAIVLLCEPAVIIGVDAAQAPAALHFLINVINKYVANAGKDDRNDGRDGHDRQDDGFKYLGADAQSAQDQAELRDLVHQKTHHKDVVRL